jgi:cell division transport system permease protein
VSRFFYLLKEAFVNMRRNLLVAVGAVLVVFVTLFLSFAAVLGKEIVRINTLAWEEGVHIIAFLKDPGSGGVPADAHEALIGDVEVWDEVEDVRYVDKAGAWIEYQEIFEGQAELLDIDPTILPASLRIELVDIELHRSVAFRLEQQQQVVLRVVTAAEQIEQLQSISTVLNVVALGAPLVLGLSAVVLIATTIRLAIYARRNEVEIMKLVGASNWYVRIPFLLEGMIEGLVGSAFAVFSVWLFSQWLADVFEGFRLFRFDVGNDFLFRWGVLFLIFGAVAGVVGSLFGVSRYLRETEGIGADVPTGTLERI